MGSIVNWRRAAMAALLVACLALAACGDDSSDGGGAGSGDGDGANASSAFPEDVYKPEVFGNLDGTVRWYDTSGGPVAEAFDATVFKDFTELTGVTVQGDYNAASTKLFAALEAGRVPWSMAMFPTIGDAMQAAEQGDLIPLDKSKVPLDQVGEDGATDHGIQVARYGIVLTWNTEKFPESGDQPSTMADLYDTAKFPGKRCFYNYPEYGWTLESALLADGVALDDLYPLDTERAYRKLDTIKDDIVWWDSGAESIQYLTTGQCDIGITWTGRIYDAITKDDAPLAFTWDEAGYSAGVFAIPKGAPNPDAAQALIAMWILDREGQIENVSRIPYITPLKSLAVTDFPEDVQPYLPTGDNLKNARGQDEEYYKAELTELAKEFTAWQGG